jgi:hypothetical protein
MLTELLRRTHLSAPADLAATVADPARRIGAQDVVLYLIDYDPRRKAVANGCGYRCSTAPSGWA